MSKLIYPNLSSKVLTLAFSVHNILGPGLLEACYEGAMVVELKQAGIPFQRQQVFPLCYKGEMVGVYIADLVVDNKIILELKLVQALAPGRASPSMVTPALPPSWLPPCRLKFSIISGFPKYLSVIL